MSKKYPSRLICLDKIRDKKGNIIKYKLFRYGSWVSGVYNIKYNVIPIDEIEQKSPNYIIYMTPQQLKNEVINGELDIDWLNLKLTTDGRIIDKTVPPNFKSKSKKPPKYLSDAELKTIYDRAKQVNLPITEVNTHCGHVCYIIHKTPQYHILIIPSNIKESHNFSKEILDKLPGTIEVLGGSGLTSTSSMFSDSHFKYINLDNFDTRNVKNMSHMFENCHTDYLDLRNVDMSKVMHMDCMFSGCKEYIIDLGNFKVDILKCTLFNVSKGYVWKMFKNCYCHIKCNDLELLRVYNASSAVGITAKEDKRKAEEEALARQIEEKKLARKKERSKVTPGMRYDVMKRDKFRCVLCGRSPKEDGVKLHVDHIKPIGKNGLSTLENLQTLCEECNFGKSNKYDE